MRDLGWSFWSGPAGTTAMGFLTIFSPGSAAELVPTIWITACAATSAALSPALSVPRLPYVAIGLFQRISVLWLEI